jgi:protein ImuA
VGPPQPPFGPALAAQGLHTWRLLWVAATLPAQRLWAAEQALRCADVDAVLAWLPQARADQLRRLQMAAASFNKLLWVLRPEQVQHESSPAVLRLWVAPLAGGGPGDDVLEVRLLKRRGPPLAHTLHLPARAAPLARLLAASRPQQEKQKQEQTNALDRLTPHT